MKRIWIVALLVLLSAGGVFADSPRRVAIDAEFLLGAQQDRSVDNHLFLEETVLGNYENRIRLNEYRVRFNAISGRIFQLRHRITVAMRVRDPSIATVTGLREQLQSLVQEHDNLLNEFRQWVGTLR